MRRPSPASVLDRTQACCWSARQSRRTSVGCIEFGIATFPGVADKIYLESDFEPFSPKLSRFETGARRGWTADWDRCRSFIWCRCRRGGWHNRFGVQTSQIVRKALRGAFDNLVGSACWGHFLGFEKWSWLLQICRYRCHYLFFVLAGSSSLFGQGQAGKGGG